MNHRMPQREDALVSELVRAFEIHAGIIASLRYLLDRMQEGKALQPAFARERVRSLELPAR